ncbi:unnamed protein product [Chrysoparadoxa australica]
MMAGSDVRTWQGVEVNRGQLSSLNLICNDLDGEIPATVGYFEYLEELNLSYNFRLVGSIPGTVGKMRHLRVLHLYSTSLTGLIPKELGKLRLLEELWLNCNQLTGMIPPELGLLSNLREMYLNSNELQGPIPATFGRLAQLEGLNLSFNKLEGPCPDQLGNLVALKLLALGGNERLTELPPSECGHGLTSWLLLKRNGQLKSLERRVREAELSKATEVQKLNEALNRTRARIRMLEKKVEVHNNGGYLQSNDGSSPSTPKSHGQGDRGDSSAEKGSRISPFRRTSAPTLASPDKPSSANSSPSPMGPPSRASSRRGTVQVDTFIMAGAQGRNAVPIPRKARKSLRLRRNTATDVASETSWDEHSSSQSGRKGSSRRKGFGSMANMFKKTQGSSKKPSLFTIGDGDSTIDHYGGGSETSRLSSPMSANTKALLRNFEETVPHVSTVLAKQAPAPYTLNRFKDFATNNLLEENLDFVCDVSELDRCPMGELAAQAQLILETFVIPGASMEVNLSSGIRKSTQKSVEEFAEKYPQGTLPDENDADDFRGVFAAAYAQIFTLIRMDAYPRFVASIHDVLARSSDKAALLPEELEIVKEAVMYEQQKAKEKGGSNVSSIPLMQDGGAPSHMKTVSVIEELSEHERSLRWAVSQLSFHAMPCSRAPQLSIIHSHNSLALSPKTVVAPEA